MRRLYPRNKLVTSPSGCTTGAAHCARLGRRGYDGMENWAVVLHPWQAGEVIVSRKSISGC